MPLVSLLINWMHPCAIEVLFLVSFLTRAAGGSSAVLPVPFGPHGLDVVHWDARRMLWKLSRMRCWSGCSWTRRCPDWAAAVGERSDPGAAQRGVAGPEEGTRGRCSGGCTGLRAAVRMEWLRWSDGAARVQGGTAARPEPGIRGFVDGSCWGNRSSSSLGSSRREDLLLFLEFRSGRRKRMPRARSTASTDRKCQNST